jgi:pimeloyl-ACP methyl ester carboxylesterase/DNA-binding SARP family transcriptional activator
MWFYADRVQVRVLGSAAITDTSGREVTRPERKARELLAILAVRAPGAVTIDELVDLLWDDPPESAVKTIRAHLSRLRAALHAAGVAGDIERVGNAAYRLTVLPGATDVDVIAELRRRSRQLVADGRPDSAASILQDARRLWSGDPELPDTIAGTAVLRGWRRNHRQLVLEHLQCVVEGSDPNWALAELEGHVATDPTDEPMAVLHVRALHRSGHQTNAVRAVAATRAALADIGLDAGSELRRVEAEVFADSLDLSSGPPAAATRPTPQPRNEPAVRYAGATDRHVAFTTLSAGPRDLVVLNPAMVTIDGLLDEPHARDCLARLGEHARIVCLDRRGIGLSDPLDPQRSPLDEWVDDIVHVLDALGIDSAHVLGNFDTGLIALELAARHPERVTSLTLAHCFASYLRRDGYPRGVDPTTAQQLIADAVVPAQAEHHSDTVAYAAPSLVADDSFRQWWTRIGQRGAGPATAATIRTFATQVDLREHLTRVVAPTLVVHRQSCVNVDIGHSRYLHEHLRHAELAVVPGTDALWFTDTPDLLDRVIEFIDRN